MKFTTVILQLLPLLHLASARHHKTTTTTTTPTKSTKSATSTSAKGSPTGCAPGYYLPEITNFELQLPYGPGNSPLVITGSELSGCSGFQNASWFYWDDAGSYLVMKAPPSDTNCAKTTNSLHCRTEFREENPASWSASGTNTMTVRLAVPAADDGSHGTVIGQVFSAEYSKPVAELYYEPSGNIYIGVEQSTAGGDEIFTKVGSVPEGTVFTYELGYSNDVFTVTINGGSAQSFPTSQLGNPNSYFKVGDYNQGKSVFSEVDVYSIAVVHS
jgi:hypothetical protein